MKTASMIVLLALLTLGFPSQALAHSIETDFKVDQQSHLNTQSQYSNGEPLQFAPVEVYTPGDLTQPKLVGSTDAEGRFSVALDPSQKGEWKVAIGDIKKSDHGDILFVGVTDKGIDVSQAQPPQRRPFHNWIALGVAGIAGVVTSRWLTRNRFWT
jgi:nickel transport protein